MSPTKIGVIGLGLVGGAVNRYFSDAGYDLSTYDRFKCLGSPETVSQTDVIFICVPTPYQEPEGFDCSAVDDAVSRICGQKIVVIKSTVLPGTTERLQNSHPQHRILFNPEFLRESSAYEDYVHPDRQVLGVTSGSQEVADEIIALLPAAPFVRVVSATAAETAKYMCNGFLALKVVYANQMYDLCSALSVDYNTVSEIAAADVRIGASHLDVFTGSYRGYAGRCLPKDVQTLLDLGSEIGAPQPLLELAHQLNSRLLANERTE